MKAKFQTIQKMTMKKIKLILLSMMLVSSLQAQLPLEFSVEVMAPFPLRYQTWLTEAATYLIPVTNKTNQSYDFFLRATIQGVGANNSDIFIQVREDFVPNNSLHIEPYESLIFTGQEIGDSYGKTRGLSSTADIVSIDMVERGIEYGTIIVASDGLWDVLSNEAVAQKIGQLSSVPNSSSVTTICTALAMHARSMDIDPDDLTLVVARVENQAYDTNDDTNHNE